MPTFQAFGCAVVLYCLYSLVSMQTVRPLCDLNNCNRTNMEICATNGQMCRRFANECSWQRENCNKTLATVWNRTGIEQCLNLGTNATAGACACPALRTCSNRMATTIGTTATGICGHQDYHRCRLFRSECDFVKARCNLDVWQPIDIMQCRDFTFGQNSTCTCPKSQQCSRNQTQLCVQADANNCRLYDNECDLEADRCRGQTLLDVNNLHCQEFAVGINSTCTCPRLLTCQPNVTNICVINTVNRCKLISNECELERGRCQGAVLNLTQPVQCRNLRPSELGNCACPALLSCSLNRTNICVRSRIGCRLKRNECELGQARCMGEVLTSVSSLQCRGFSPGDRKPCACPRLDSCHRNNSNICVRSEQGCMLMRNECDLERSRCEGNNFTVVDSVQCINFNVGQLGNCSCPNMDSCDGNLQSVCVASSRNQCRLLANSCEFVKARCRGEVLASVNPLQCRGFPLNNTRNCLCPRLNTCSTRSTNVCIRENNTNSSCSLLRNECELERMICEGRDVKRIDNVRCKNFTINSTNTCHCPELQNCERNSTSFCVQTSTQCRLIRNECELEQMRCDGQNFINTQNVQCFNFEINQQSNCSCPNLMNCSQNSTRICARTRNGCKIFRTVCELEEAKCRGEIVDVVNSIHCQGITTLEEGTCFCPNLQNCSRNITSLCVKNQINSCNLLRNECEVEEARCRDQTLTLVSNLHCQNFTYGFSRFCLCPNLFNCSRSNSFICNRVASGCKLLRNHCELEQEKCQGETLRTVSSLHCQGFQFGQTRNCSCPNLSTCSHNTTNICVQTVTGCRLMRNECELEQAGCLGQMLKIVPDIQCKSLRAGQTGSCACPNWLTCRQNSPPVCIDTSRGCKSLRNQCELEQMKCQREVFNITSRLQCQGFVMGQLKNCACPELKTCSRSNITRICVRNRTSCQLMANNCDFELARCRGEKWCPAYAEECRNFPVGLQRPCTCPRLQTCSQNNSQIICVYWRGACKLMKNQCELEKAKCNGQAWSPTASLQCVNYKPNEWRWCACPRLLNCCNKAKTFCVRGPSGCKLMASDCELQMARCRGEVWSITDDLQCRDFILGQSIRRCTCPILATCQQNSSTTSISTQVCARNVKGCKLFRNNCELERSRCGGEGWSIVNHVQCRNFPLLDTRSCYCPALENCSNTTSVCGSTILNQCYRFRTECDMRWAVCEGQKLTLTHPQRCQGITFDSSDACKCPEMRRCNRTIRVCGRRNGKCRLFPNDCDFRSSLCREDIWQRTALTNCCNFRVNETKDCIVNSNRAVCGRTAGNRCSLFATGCDFTIANSTRNAGWRIVNRSLCQCIRGGRTGICNQRIACNRLPTDRRVCGRDGRTYRMFESYCYLRLHNYRNCSSFRAVRLRQCRNRS